MTLTTKYSSASEWAAKIIDLFFPTVCAGCGNLGPMICPQCRSQFQWVKEPLCRRCGRSSINPTNICGYCSSADFHLRQVRSPLFYHDPLTTIIHEMKYTGLYALTKPLAQIMVRTWPEWEASPELLLPIPLHSQRKKKRGFNQSELIARHLGQELDIEVNAHSLIRVKNTIPQVGLSPDKRQGNVKDAFQSKPDALRGKNILLIDDVYTTGATMLAAAASLYAAGAASVSAYCLARAV